MWLPQFIKNIVLDAAAEKAKDILDPNTLLAQSWALVNAALAKVTAGVPDEKMDVYCGYCERGAALLSTIAGAIRDKRITDAEADLIRADFTALFGDVVTKAWVDEKVDGIVRKIKAL